MQTQHAEEKSQVKLENLKLYKRLLRYSYRYWYFMLIGVIGFALFATMEALLIRSVEFFLNTLAGKPTPSSLPPQWTDSILFVPIAILVLSFFRGIGFFLGNFYMSKLGLSIVNTIRKDVFSHMAYLPQSFFDQRNSGELVSLIIYNIQQVTGSVTNALKIGLRDGFSLIGLLAILFYYSWKLTLIFIVVGPILAFLVYVAGRYFRRMSRKIQSSMGRITHITTESIQGIRLVKSYRGEDYENQRFSEAADENLKFGTKYERVSAIQTPVLHFIVAISLAVIFYLVIVYWEGSAAQAVAYVTAAGLLQKPFRQLSNLNAVIAKGLAAAETIFTTLDMPLESRTGDTPLKHCQGKIEFNNVSFSYDQQHQALNNVSFNIAPGQTVAIVGRSGSGKTTVASLLLRFYEIQKGKIFIDGTDITQIDLEDLRTQIAFVTQQTVLFNTSVRANITYGNSEKDYNEDEMMLAAKQAHAEEFIKDLPEGYDSELGEDGGLLSGGQRQRIAIARAFYKDAPILILDEATSALDNESEKKIQSALEKLKQNRTTIVIAHRLSTIENADLIIVMEDGKIMESGNHNSLLRKKGYYHSLYHTNLESGSAEMDLGRTQIGLSDLAPPNNSDSE